MELVGLFKVRDEIWVRMKPTLEESSNLLVVRSLTVSSKWSMDLERVLWSTMEKSNQWKYQIDRITETP